MSEDNRPLDVKEAATEAGVDLKTMYESVRAGLVPSFRLGRLIKIPKPAFRELLRNGKISGRTV
jgi:excisionase family DNA binding protein